MNIAYYRDSSHDMETTIENIQKTAIDLGFKVLGQVGLDQIHGTAISLCKTEWLSQLMVEDPNLIGLLPCSLVVFEKDGKIKVGAGQPSILGSVSRNPKIASISTEAEASIKELIHQAAGVEPLQPKSIKLYATTSCPYCKMEESWLKEHDIDFDMVLVDMNREAAEELVKNTGQMGVPVTEIQYEDADSEYIVGFDKGTLSSILSIEQ